MSLLVFKLLMGYTLTILLVVGNACSHHQEQNDKVEQPPNVVLIMADDLGMEALRSYGGESYHTPNLDRLAATGMQFEHCYSTPLCTPSRVQIMTGKYNFRNYFAFGMLGAEERTFGHAFKQAGYQTSIAGKWQLYGNKRQRELADGRTGTLPEAAGFDSYRLWQVKDRGWRYKTPTLETKSEGLITYDEEYGPDKFVEFIEKFITDNQKKPFLVYYPMCLVHDPFLPTPDSNGFESYDPELNINDTTFFADMVSYMDHQVGRIVSKLEELALREKTVIIFTGDNGTDRKVVSSWNGQRIAGMKGYTVSAGTHVPLIANWKDKIAPGQVNSNLIDFTDFYPTLMDLAGIEEPSLDGLSFYQQLLGKKAAVRDWVFCHYEPRWGKFTNRRYVQNKVWKLYGNGDFYNFQDDPEEQYPISEENLSPEQIQLKNSFQRVLDRMNG